MVVDKGSVTPPILGSKEQIHKEPSQDEQLEQRATNEVSKERKIVEYPQSLSQDTEMQATSSTETEKTQGEPS